MAVYFQIKKHQKSFYHREIFMVKSKVDEERRIERDATIKIQSWFRSIQVQKFIRFQNECAIKIQKSYRAYVGRIIYRKLVRKKMNEMRMLYYDQMATMIQARWRGYYTRKYKSNFYARKEYLDAIIVTNENVRQELERIKMENLAEEEAQRFDKELNQTLYKNRKNHYLLSTRVCRGIYNSPTKASPEKEMALFTVSPLSQEERMLIASTQKNAFLKTATGIPTENKGEIKEKKIVTLPPLKDRNKPQGPFRSPSEVTRQRYKQLEPSLRVATDYKSIDKARTKLRENDWTKRVIDKSFLPSTKRSYSYSPSLHTTTSYDRNEYGTKHFRVTEEIPSTQPKAFQRVVSPIPLFDQLGKTY